LIRLSVTRREEKNIVFTQNTFKIIELIRGFFSILTEEQHRFSNGFEAVGYDKADSRTNTAL
jgi:hypothetical protein